MKSYWQLDTHGKPLERMRKFISQIWEGAEIERMLAPVVDLDRGVVSPTLLDSPAQLERFNPFVPLMSENTARLIPRLAKSRPGQKLGVILRPCEMRALVEVRKHNGFQMQNILTFCVDCLGTYPQADFHWRTERKGDVVDISQETLQFSRQGGIAAYRNRPACQACASPAAEYGDINIHVLGLPARQTLLVHVGDGAVADFLRKIGVTDGQALHAAVLQHQRTLNRLAERHQETYDHVRQGLASSLPETVSEVAHLLANCYACQECMDACPICSVDYPEYSPEGTYSTQDITRWLVSCAACGMCEENCPNYLPLTTIFRQIRDQLGVKLSYYPGRSVLEPLPVV